MNTHFHLFVYGTLRSNGAAVGKLVNSQLIGRGSVGGVLYDMDGDFPALVLYGNNPVHGEVWRCPVELLRSLDIYERVDEGLFRRVGVEVRMENGTTQGCWTYVAGPRLSRKLTPARRIDVWV
jgi:gamma-glutamylcyclotransferase (GGCT)/AIG2-like uncharacterized protein YtfP